MSNRSDAKPMSQTEIRKQVKSNEDVIKHIVLKNLKREGFKVIADTFKLHNRHFVKSMSLGKIYSMEYVVKLDNKVAGLTGMEVAGDFDFPVIDLKNGDAIFTKKRCIVHVRAGYEVNASMGYYECNDWN